MLYRDPDGEDFYRFAMTLFYETDHISASEPLYINHSSERFMYFDVSNDVALTEGQRMLLKNFDNISKLFSVNDCDFFSINLQTTKGNRSQTAHDIHTMFHPLLQTKASICLFRWENEVMLTFVGYEKRCMLSDWYQMDLDYNALKDKLDICNMYIGNNRDYFYDIIYYLARSYYTTTYDGPVYALLPIDIFKNGEHIDKEEINEYIRDLRLTPIREYGDDYVEYDDTTIFEADDISNSIEAMLLDLDDLDNISEDNPSRDELEDQDFEEDDEFVDEEDAFVAKEDEYEFDDVNPEIFKDPTLMVKWLKKNSPT